MGVRVCLEGASPESDRMVEELKAVRTRMFDQEIARLRAGAFNQAPQSSGFTSSTRFFPMGVKMVGAFCDAIRTTDLIDPGKYLAGFQIIPDEIPDFGAINSTR